MRDIKKSLLLVVCIRLVEQYGISVTNGFGSKIQPARTVRVSSKYLTTSDRGCLANGMVSIAASGSNSTSAPQLEIPFSKFFNSQPNGPLEKDIVLSSEDLKNLARQVWWEMELFTSQV